jgi:hypothetical protein
MLTYDSTKYTLRENILTKFENTPEEKYLIILNIIKFTLWVDVRIQIINCQFKMK